MSFLIFHIWFQLFFINNIKSVLYWGSENNSGVWVKPPIVWAQRLGFSPVEPFYNANQSLVIKVGLIRDNINSFWLQTRQMMKLSETLGRQTRIAAVSVNPEN